MSIYMQTEYVVIECGAPGCDQHFAVTRRFYDETQNGQGWHCPRGHSRRWKGQTTQQKLDIAEARQRHLEDQLRASEAEAEATRVKLLRDRSRFAKGVCPCCNRSFPNVARHMESKHPEYDPADLTAPRYECSCGRSFDTAHGLRIHQGKNRPQDWNDPKMSQWRRHLTKVGR